ncbi:MAG TPA: magnesium/cobalt transporter CorA [Planctomycetaceae bacterium]|nr:magnesium/cobalt transporter CorA [Planctomycetaceae bacterium]HQZ64327.1 magnesium/cobalt transporter CorA [Planctomycetaceae bacterium]
MSPDAKHGIYRGFRRSSGIGALPGTIDRGTDPISEKCCLTRISYNAQLAEEEVIDTVAELNEEVPEDRVYWFRLEGVADPDTLRRLGEAFEIHPLALEDVVNTHQRCKVEDYGDHLFVVIRLPAQAANGDLTTEQVSLFIGDGFVVSIHEGSSALEVVRERIMTGRGRIREYGADYLAYTILDLVIDNYFPIIERIGNRLNEIDEQLEFGFDLGQRLEIRGVRSDLLLLRRTVWPQREAIAALMRDDCTLISNTTRTYLRDCYDHTIQLMDVIETYRELCADLRDYHLAEISLRSNEVMKTLTVIATLFMPLSFIAGFYGMNFQNMPELKSKIAYPLTIATMLTVAISLLFWFRRRGWI